MSKSIVRIIAAATVVCAATGLSERTALGAPAAKPKPAQTNVAAKALQIVAIIHGLWQRMPGNIATWRMTGGALLGNGSVGVAIGGTPDKQQFYLGRNDFWSVLRGSIMPVGRLQLSIPSLAGASAQLSENIGPADVIGTFAQGNTQLKTKSWVAAGQNTLFLQLDNSGQTPIEVSAALLDGFGQTDRDTLGGATGNVSWLRVSPEVVHATIGGLSEKDPGPASDAAIRSVRVFDSFQPSPQHKPAYHWDSSDALNTSAVFSCGNIIMPQRRFSVTASINLAHADGSGVLFDALVEHRWMQQAQDPTDPLGNTRGHDVPRAQGAEAGLLVSVSHGKLIANLNGTVLTSTTPLPTGQWTNVAVAYDGSKMVLTVNGAPAGETSNFPTAAQVMGPQFSWMASHPGDPQLPFNDIAPQGILATRILGATVTQADGESRFTIPAGGHVTFAVAASDDRDTFKLFSGRRLRPPANQRSRHRQHPHRPPRLVASVLVEVLRRNPR